MAPQQSTNKRGHESSPEGSTPAPKVAKSTAAAASSSKTPKKNLGGASQMTWYNALVWEEEEKMRPVLRNLL